MNSGLAVFLAALEVICLVVVVLLWKNRWHRSRLARVLWSLVLLVPAFGLLAYFFLRQTPDEHSDECNDTTGAESLADECGLD